LESHILRRRAWATELRGVPGTTQVPAGPGLVVVAPDGFAQQDRLAVLKRSMNISIHGDTLSIEGVKELSAANASAFRDEVRTAMREPLRNIEIDLSQALFLDSCGLGVLVALHKTACNRNGLVRLINPAPAVRQILELTRMHRIFEVVKL